MTGDPSGYTKDHSKFTIPNFKETSINIYTKGSGVFHSFSLHR